mmetsp:Transcript_3115/g.4429  ORF Transcript_3115/g.4429 Transcript_3115/m.4429 type:complete len:85 (+) Transcript_3115:35-289(+)
MGNQLMEQLMELLQLEHGHSVDGGWSYSYNWSIQLMELLQLEHELSWTTLINGLSTCWSQIAAWICYSALENGHSIEIGALEFS